jgi:hypothetical protein
LPDRLAPDQERPFGGLSVFDIHAKLISSPPNIDLELANSLAGFGLDFLCFAWIETQEVVTIDLTLLIAFRSADESLPGIRTCISEHGHDNLSFSVIGFPFPQ